ncbi:hypothetical protein HLI01_01420 [Rhizobium laguerreae]|uniref:AbiJ-NTD4 domain-containing protein n=1 Tax=Rhizobium laguerreae TaxID=1076926 RepID=UPI0014792C66|nr:hypothetical protein [Rhizobium laguerreae]NNH55504.1 hypothetical protein [Rhizobium laguerreae]
MQRQGFGLSTDYFTDREYGQRPAVSETIDERVWGAIHALIDMRIGNGAFGYRFTEQCSDGDGPCGCDERAFAQFLQAEVPWINWPLIRSEVPETPIVLDLLEFCAKAVGEPILGSYHSYQHHHHMRWDRDAGLKAFVAEVNVLFQRNGVAFKLDINGQAQRILPQPIAHALGWTMFRTGDAQTDSLLEYARSHFLSPKLDDRRDATEKLWDSFERMKTLEPGADKRAQAEALLDRAAIPGSPMRHVLAEEAKMLTAIGNSFRIRHSEVTQVPIERSDQLDWLFVRMFSFLRLLLLSSGRSA